MKYTKRIFTFFSGCILPFAFAPYSFWPLAIISLTCLFISIISYTPKLHFISIKHAFFRGFLFGLGFFGVGASWVFISIHTYGNTNVFIALLITSLFVFALSLFMAAQIALTAFLPISLRWMTFPACGVAFEWLRSWVLSGFPWLLLGQSQTTGLFKGFVPLLGAYGVSFLLYFCSVLLFDCVCLRRWWTSILIFALLVSGYLLNTIHWTHAYSTPLSVTLIQGNIPQETKWSEEQVLPTLKIYTNFTQQSWNSQLIFWPEGAITLPYPYSENVLTQLAQISSQHHSALVVGLPAQINQSFSYYNAIAAVGKQQQFYYKRHLVPFGEYVPLSSLLRGLIGFFDLPMSDFSAGPYQQPLLQTDNAKLGTFICYEVAYPRLLFSTIKQNPDFLATLSNDAWFGASWAPYQHAQIAQFAAILTGRYMLLNANSGLTAIFDERGTMIKSLPLFVRDKLDSDVFKVHGLTPWDHYGDTPILIFAGLLILTGFIHRVALSA